MSQAKQPQHPLMEIAASVDKTHEGLGKLFAFSLISTKAGKVALIISPPGTGKSTSSDLILLAYPGSFKISAMTSAGLDPWQERFTGFNSVLVMDDLGRLNTMYRRLYTVSTLAELAYSHYAEDHTGHQHLSITGFNGSSIINCQPVVLKSVVRSGDWEATVSDKTLRYYHLKRPKRPYLSLPQVQVDTGRDFSTVKTPDLESGEVAGLVTRGFMQWGEARSRQHIGDLLKACAAFRHESEVNESDVSVLQTLIRPCWVERFAMDKKSLEGERILNTDLLYLFTEFISYGEVTLRQLMINYKISERTARRFMDNHPRLVEIVGKTPTRWKPSKEMEALLKEVE